MKLIIVDKVINLLCKNGSMSLKELYESLPEHTESSIRGNINRYLQSENPKIQRVAKGVYMCVEIISSQKQPGGKILISYSANFFVEEKSVHFFHKEFICSEDILTDNLGKITEFKSFDEMQKYQHGLEAMNVYS